MAEINVTKKGETWNMFKLPNAVVMPFIFSAVGAAVGVGVGVVIGSTMDIKELVNKVTR